MSTEHVAFSSYRVWAPRNVGLPPVSVSDGVKAPMSASERAHIVYERQWMQQSAAERRSTATKRVASVPVPQLNRHLISLGRTAVADERNWACLGVRQPWYHESESRTAKFYGVRLPPMCNSGLMDGASQNAARSFSKWRLNKLPMHTRMWLVKCR